MKNLILLLSILLTFSVHAQQYYYNGNQKVMLSESTDSFITYESPSNTITQGFSQTEETNSKGYTILKGRKKSLSTSSLKAIGSGQTMPALQMEGEDLKMYTTKRIRVKLKSDKDLNKVLKLLDESDIASTNFRRGILEINVKDIHKTIDLANRIYESRLVDFSIPDFYVPITFNQQPVQDPLFNLQFQMNNTGQVIDGVAGVNDMDCNALEAWNLSLGDNVTVAVIDQGMEAHEDFGNRLIGGFTPANNGDGTPTANNATHGMECAGVIGASHNNIGVRGVAPNVNFLSVNIFANGTSNADVADGIRWAVDSGADVISNSWGFQCACTFTNADIDDALQFAVANGVVVIFASGNCGGCVEYPAASSNVISVGAFNNRGVLFGYSARGPELDLTAPSGQTNYMGNIRTTDRMGVAGRVNGNYQARFGGTSAACPVVAGTAALMLSVNPNLTPNEVRTILTTTATDMGANGFDNNFGFGRVNAFAAVELAENWCPLPDMTNAIIRDGGTVYQHATYTFRVSGDQYSDYFVWDIPIGWSISAYGNKRSANITPTSTGRHRIYARAHNSCGFNWVSAELCVQGPGYSCSGFIDEDDPCANQEPGDLPCLPDDPHPWVSNSNVDFSEIKIYQNQSRQLVLQGLPANTTVQFHNLSGQLISRITTKNEFYEIIDSTNLREGVIIVSISSSGSQTKQKILLR